MTDEEIISLNRMKLFARSSDLSIVTAKDMNIVVTLVEKQQKEIEELKKNKGYHLGFIDGGIAKRYEMEDKIKTIIEEVQKDLENSKDAIEANIILGKKLILQSLLDKEE